MQKITTSPSFVTINPLLYQVVYMYLLYLTISQFFISSVVSFIDISALDLLG